MLLAGYKRNSDGSVDQAVAFQVNNSFKVQSYYGKYPPLPAGDERESCFHVVTVPQWYTNPNLHIEPTNISKRRLSVLLTSTSGMPSVIGLGEDDKLADWFVPEDKRAELPLEKPDGMYLFVVQRHCYLLFTDKETFPLGACIDFTKKGIQQ